MCWLKLFDDENFRNLENISVYISSVLFLINSTIELHFAVTVVKHAWVQGVIYCRGQKHNNHTRELYF